MVTVVTQNSQAGASHPDDPNLKISLVSNVSKDGLPNASMEGSHAYGYSGGQLITDTWTVNGAVYVKTYTYSSGILSAESGWVKQ